MILMLCSLALWPLSVRSIARSQSEQTAASLQVIEQGKFILYKYQAKVGEETYEIARDSNSVVAKSTFGLSYLGGKVSLATTWRAKADLTPERFEIKGDTSTQSHVDIAVEINGRTANVRDGKETKQVGAPERFFTTIGYAPMTMQMLLMQYWINSRGPQKLATLPGGEVTIEHRGRDIITVGGKQVHLERFSVGGLIWGRETVWLDPSERLAAAVMVDAEQDRFETVREGYESALQFFVTKAAQDSVDHLVRLSSSIAPERTGAFAITGGTLIDVTGKGAINDAVVVIEGDRITSAGPRARVQIPRGAAIIDARGKTLLPGLWEMHSHYVQVELGPAYLAAGVTTVRDCGTDFDFIVPVRAAMHAGRALGPRLLLAGYIDGEGETGLGIMRAKTPEEARAIVNRYQNAGFEQIKIYGNTVMKPEVIAAITSEAHRLGMTVTGHVPRGMNAMQAVEAGYDQINHIGFMARVMMPPTQPGAPPPRLDPESAEAKRAIQFFKQRGTVLEPTFARFELNTHPVDTPFSAFEPSMPKVPRELADILNHTGVPAAAAERARASAERFAAVLLALHRGGIPIIAGIDLVVPGHSLHRELELYVKAGLTPLEAIQTATINAARAMKLEREVGNIEAGKRADLVILDANPLEAISNIRKVKFVVAGGKLYDPARLWQSVGFKP
jgi:imidazolonepropionase-like amidohydrolase